MRPEIEFFAHGLPKGQPRPRAFARKMGAKYVARVFDAGTAEAWKGDVAQAARPHRPTEPIDGPVRVDLRFIMPRPKSHLHGAGPTLRIKPQSPLFHVAKPDADNLAKAVLDALTQVGGFWYDDNQVAQLVVWKCYPSHVAGDAGCHVTITEADSA